MLKALEIAKLRKNANGCGELHAAHCLEAEDCRI